MTFTSPPATRYASVVDRSVRDPHTMALDLVGPGKRVLEVGCAVGSVSAALREQDCRVVGVEIDADAAIEAKRHCEEVFVGDVESIDLDPVAAWGPFDVALFGDVLEHLRDPTSVLRRIRPLLAPEGGVVASIPNIAHGSVRLALLRGRFEYTPLGLLDVTHLRFFTASSVQRLFSESGFVITDLERFVADPFGTEIALDPGEYSAELIAELRADPEAMTYTFLVRAVPADGRHWVEDVRAREERLQREVTQLRGQVRELTSALGLMQTRWDCLEARLPVRLYRRLQRLSAGRRRDR